MSLGTKEHRVEKRAGDRGDHWVRLDEKGRTRGLSLMRVLSGTQTPTGLTSSSWTGIRPFHPHTDSSFSLWWSEFQGKKLKALFWWGGSRRIVLLHCHPCAFSLHGSHCQLWPHHVLLAHHLHVWVDLSTQQEPLTEGPLCCVCTTLLPFTLWSLNGSVMFTQSALSIHS